eukprot:CAMPEP_0201095066 /NCGR_PEP_ID=MMETSP0812-20130820/3623_1 /ASSEMBLY_ACC=CAM_ASM_000668 /TAXON_ID=98059 /ORGANISM="Dinobryon sp., Strain UTEXLB2267" /LENGTH=201 /DNA_ID=CAMNT_0047348231 /DNA_START=48 /DNA_END=650 /DNA_ORIENTATION=-
MALLLAKLSNPLLMEIVKFLGITEDDSDLFVPFLQSLNNILCVCKSWRARFDPQDLNLWGSVAFDSHIDVDFSSTTNKNYLKVLLQGNAQKQLRKLVKKLTAISTVKTNNSNPSIICPFDFSTHDMAEFLDSGEMDPWPYAIRAYSNLVSIQERYVVAKAALNTIAFIANRRNKFIRNKLVEVPDLFASVADLCDEEVLLQ